MPKRTRKYEESLLEDLRDPAEAAAYLNLALDSIGEPDGTALFLLALGNVIRAQGVSEVAKGAELGRESLYKSISAAGNPRLKSVPDILRVMGLRISVEAQAKPSRQKATKRQSRLAKAS